MQEASSIFFPFLGRRQIHALGFLLGWLLTFASPSLGLEPPAFQGYVNDYAKLFSPATAQAVEQTLRSFEETDSTQVAVLTIDSLDGDAIEDFCIRTVEKWGVGQRGKDNGVLLLVVKNDRKLRIEVGRGLEGVLTDLTAGRIIDTVIRPPFKAGRFDEGLQSGVAAIIQSSRGEFTAEPKANRPGQRPTNSPALPYLLFGLFITSFLGRASRPLGMVAGAILLPLTAFFGIPALGFFLLLLLIPLGAVLGLLLPFIMANLPLGFGGISLGGGAGGDGFGGFGGFGGGSFGGGGASGDW